MRTVNAKCGAIIPIGRLGENEATAVVFDVADYETLFGAGVFTLLHQRSGDTAPYPCSIEYDGTTVTWTVTSADLGVQGYGKCELVYTVNDTVAKSVIYTTVTGAALTGGIEPPEPWEDWIERVLEAGAAAVEAAESAGTSAESAGASAETATEKASDAAQSAGAAGAEARAAEAASSVAAEKATDASNSASAAATSETNAATSASASASSASTASAAATAAQSARAAAETAQSGAEQAKADAQTAKTDAQTAAATANTKAGEAAQSATNAGASATAAQAAQTAAESAQNAAETAQSASAASATTASEHATAAANSATNASTSATAADTAKTAAQNAATTATQQATAAATSASDAATSAQNASESATGAATSATAAENAKDAAIAALEAFHEPTATAQTLQPGTPATASYDGQNFTFGIPQGEQGIQGVQGLQGPAGADGADGENGITPTIGANGNWYLGSTDTGKPSRGIQGEQGIQGIQGEQGIQGVQGERGEQGIQGQQGVPGANGQDGADGITPHIDSTTKHWMIGDTDTGIVAEGQDGAQGAQGAPGQDGQPGADGADGADGVTFTPSVDAAGNISWTNDGGRQNPPTQNIKGAQGAPGQDGLTTSITVNGETFTQSGGNVNLGTLLRQHQSLAAYRTSAAQDTIDAGKAVDSAVVHNTGAENINGTKTFKDSIYLDASTPFIIGKNGKGGFRAVNTSNAQVGQMNISDGWYGSGRYGVQISALDSQENKHNQLRVSHNGPQYIVYDNNTGTETVKNILDESKIQYSATDIGEGASLATGAFYFVYE